jgi:hypothetical protein
MEPAQSSRRRAGCRSMAIAPSPIAITPNGNKEIDQMVSN